MAVDANGAPIEFIISDGATHDVKVAPNLINCLNLKETEILCADKDYDSEFLKEKNQSYKNKSQYSKEM